MTDNNEHVLITLQTFLQDVDHNFVEASTNQLHFARCCIWHFGSEIHCSLFSLLWRNDPKPVTIDDASELYESMQMTSGKTYHYDDKANDKVLDEGMHQPWEGTSTITSKMQLQEKESQQQQQGVAYGIENVLLISESRVISAVSNDGSEGNQDFQGK